MKIKKATIKRVSGENYALPKGFVWEVWDGDRFVGIYNTKEAAQKVVNNLNQYR